MAGVGLAGHQEPTDWRGRPFGSDDLSPRLASEPSRGQQWCKHQEGQVIALETRLQDAIEPIPGSIPTSGMVHCLTGASDRDSDLVVMESEVVKCASSMTANCKQQLPAPEVGAVL
jgi:hypothetical protein